MPYMIAIRKNATGEVRMHAEDGEWYHDEGDRSFAWSEGNWNCDENRYLFFERAAGNKPPMREEHACCTGEYDVLYVELPSGERIEPKDWIHDWPNFGDRERIWPSIPPAQKTMNSVTD